jgi:putative DNA primase/helicase
MQDVMENANQTGVLLVPPSPIPPQILKALQRGWEVFPLRTRTKTGFYRTVYKNGGEGYSWQRQATNNIEQVAKWAVQFPGCNWGARTGHTSGFFVIDVDTPEAMQRLIDTGAEILYLVQTGHTDGNRHQVYFNLPKDVRGIITDSDIFKGNPKGFDVRGDKNGFVLLSGSIHPHGNPYKNLTEPEVLPDPTQLLLDVVVETEKRARETVDLSLLPELTKEQKDFSFRIARKRCAKLKETARGGRHNELIKVAAVLGGLTARDAFSWEFAQELLLDAMIEDDDPAHFKRYMESEMRWGSVRPLDIEGMEEYSTQKQLQQANFPLNPPLPDGASPVPLPPQESVALSPMERMVANSGTQHAIAVIFEARYKDKMLYDHTRQEWLVYDGTRWVVDGRKTVHHFILGIASEMNNQNKAAMVTSQFCNGVNKHLQSFPTFSRTSEDFDKDHWLLNTPSGTLDLRTHKMYPHDPSDMITLCTSAAPDDESDGADFQKFMKEITGNDEELIRFHQVSLGATLSGAVEAHWLLFWYGVPRAGKNTLGELTEGAMGDYARTIPTSTLMSKKFESHPTEMANLKGIRLATSSELSDRDHWDEARLKQLTGDAKIPARWIGGNWFEFDRTHKHLIYGNYRPQLRSADEAVRARLKIVPFKHSFVGKEDLDLPAKLKANQGFVLQWMIEGHQQWLDAGKKLPHCAAVDAEIAEYFEGQSTPRLWLKECCDVLEREDRADLQLHTVVECYRNYKRWKEDRGESALSQTRWEPEALNGLEVVRTRKGKCVRKLRLLLLDPPFNFPLPPVTSSPTASESFDQFATRQ